MCGPPHLHVVGKRVSPVTAAAAAAPKGAHSCLLYLVDVASSKQYLMDSGSAFSILPHKSSAEPTGPHLMTVDGKPLTCWGRRMCTVRTRTRECLWTFLLAPVAFPVLGADFLSNFRLLVDSSNKRQVARGCKLIQLEQGKWTKVSVVTGVVAAAPPPALTPSSPSPHTVEALPSTVLLHFPQWKAAKKPKAALKASWWQRPRQQRWPPLPLHFPQWRHLAVTLQGSLRPDST